MRGLFVFFLVGGRGKGRRKGGRGGVFVFFVVFWCVREREKNGKLGHHFRRVFSTIQQR